MNDGKYTNHTTPESTPRSLLVRSTIDFMAVRGQSFKNTPLKTGNNNTRFQTGGKTDFKLGSKPVVWCSHK